MVAAESGPLSSLRDREGGSMRVAVVGKGNVGGGLADRWERAGHEVTRIGRGGGDVSDAEAVLIAVPAGSVGEALDQVQGIEGKTAIDATNLVGTDPPEGFSSNAEFVKSKTNGPTAKSFNINFARLYDQLDSARATPSNLWCGDEEAREVVEQLIRDAGYDPVYAGPLENAALQEGFIQLVFAVRDLVPAAPDQLELAGRVLERFLEDLALADRVLHTAVPFAPQCRPGVLGGYELAQLVE